MGYKPNYFKPRNYKARIFWANIGSLTIYDMEKKETNQFQMPEFKEEIHVVSTESETNSEYSMPDNSDWKPEKIKTPQIDKFENAIMDQLKLARLGADYIREIVIDNRVPTKFTGKNHSNKTVDLPKFKEKLDTEELKTWLELVNSNARTLSALTTQIIALQRHRNQLNPDPNNPTKMFDIDTFFKTGDVKFTDMGKKSKRLGN